MKRGSEFFVVCISFTLLKKSLSFFCSTQMPSWTPSEVLLCSTFTRSFRLVQLLIYQWIYMDSQKRREKAWTNNFYWDSVRSTNVNEKMNTKINHFKIFFWHFCFSLYYVYLVLLIRYCWFSFDLLKRIFENVVASPHQKLKRLGICKSHLRAFFRSNLQISRELFRQIFFLSRKINILYIHNRM